MAKANFTPTHPSYDQPTISILSPLNATYDAKVLLNFNISVGYPSSRNIYYTSYFIDNHEHVVFNNSTHGKDNINWSTTETLTEGTHTLQISVSIESAYLPPNSATIQKRTFTSQSDTVYFTVVIPPEISNLSIENKTYNQNTLPLNFTVNKPVSNATYCLDKTANITLAGNTTLRELSEGLHSIVVYANDSAGNIGVSNVTYFTIDTTPPIISGISIENMTYLATSKDLNFTVNEPTSWIGYSLDGKANTTIAGNTTLNGLLAGAHNLTIYSNDAAGNMGSSETIYFTTEPEPLSTNSATPPPPIGDPSYGWIILAIIAVTVVSIGLIVYFKKKNENLSKREPFGSSHD